MISLLLTFLLIQDHTASIKAQIQDVIRDEEAVYSVAFKRYDIGQILKIDADRIMHAASTMKLPVMMRLMEMVEKGELALDRPITIKNRFKSIVDGSEYEIDEDSDQSLYGKVGKQLPLIEVMELMIVRSSNLATNLLVELAGPDEIMALMKRIGARNIKVLRGVQDLKAYEAGLSNECSAAAMLTVLDAVLDPAYFSATSRKTMMDILYKQEFHDMIKPGLPKGSRVANKPGSISTVSHDAAIVDLPDGGRFLLVIFTQHPRGDHYKKRIYEVSNQISAIISGSM